MSVKVSERAGNSAAEAKLH